MPKVQSTREKQRKYAPARTIEGREDQLIALAIQRAEEQLLNGTASAQVITHFLKLGSTKERLEKEIMEEQKKLLEAKTEAIKAEKTNEELFKEVINVMTKYNGEEYVDDNDVIV